MNVDIYIYIYMQHKSTEICGIYGVPNIDKILYCMHHLRATVLHIDSITGLEQLDDVM